MRSLVLELRNLKNNRNKRAPRHQLALYGEAKLIQVGVL